ncbi:MOSC domain-containing protein [Actinacidiphila oryziradicis]|uniref:MOSC domain-containing protein n=1 Tax=Actinacidiphila oryziradicis TaxID=2571141 RepID=A0A4U0SIR7_9ACTN|nr:MOSC N-terminal beta barrel domain-containing protein [Actinacidiphila oryziradicis]TKA08808.1 MOSC domain-containing protein [Actinacidiphila oryziradicis]
MITPHLSSLHIYPVKSVHGQTCHEAIVEPWGLSGDRRWMLVDRSGRFITQREQPRLALVAAEPLAEGGLRLTAPECPELVVGVPVSGIAAPVTVWKDKVEAVPAGAEAAAWFSAYLGSAAGLVHLDDPARRRPVDPEFGRPGETVSFADGFPLLLTATASLHALNSLIARGDHAQEGPVPMDRFRPNAVIVGTEPWAEDSWRRIRIGEVIFRVAKPCGRCVVTTTDQHTAERGKEPLRTLARHRRSGNQVLFGQNLIPEHRGTLRVGDPLHILE